MSAGKIASKQTVTFLLDGQPHTPPPFAPDTTLLNYLRDHLNRKGTKEGCAEGDCGACTVMVAELYHGRLRYRAVNACIQLLATLDGKALFTVESLQRDKQLHPAQQAMVDCHGSQCGFCTPGFVMSLFALYQNQPDASRTQVSQALSGNLCRCTGYRPILDAGQRMYAYADQFPENEQDEQKLADTLAAWHEQQASLAIAQGGKRFFAPISMAELSALLEQYPDATLLAGSTDVGLWITKQHRDLPVIISLGKVAGLDKIQEQNGWLEIAATVALEDAFQSLTKHYPQLSELHERFASLPIRNSGTLVGNVANGSPIGDSMPALMVLGAKIRLRKGDSARELALEDFYLGYQKKDLRAGEFVEAVLVPLPDSGKAFSLLRCYKISKRFEQDISAVCAAFHISVDEQQHVSAARIAYGGMAATPKRASHCEAVLLGQAWNKATVSTAMNALEQDFQPLSDMRASADYRIDVAKNLLLKCLLEKDDGSLARSSPLPQPRPPQGGQGLKTITPTIGAPLTPSPLAGEGRDGGEALNQHVGKPIKHDSAELHVTGAAQYTDDLPEPRDTLYAAIGLSQQAHARLRSVNLDAVRQAPGIIAVITAADIPGVNHLGGMMQDEPVLATETVEYIGQSIFAVAATSMEAARRAVLLAEIDYEPLPHNLAIQQAVEQQQFVLPSKYLQRGQPDAKLQQARHKLSGGFHLGGQEQFYLEGMVAMALPREHGDVLIYNSTQHPHHDQKVVADVLGLTEKDIVVECRRMGGAFGGKESQPSLFASIASLLALKTGRAVKLRLDRDDDITITGKRHCYDIQYEAGFDDTGVLQAVKLEYASRCGISADLSGPVNDRSMFHADNAYYLEHVDIVSHRCKTNSQSNTAFRGFGGPQGMMAIEYVLDDVARHLQLDPLQVRRANFYGTDGVRSQTHYGMEIEDNIIQRIVDELEVSSCYQQRRAAITEFNRTSPWLKKGIALTPVKFGISFTATFYNQAGALIHIHSDGSVQVNHGGMEMGQGLYTKVAQVVAEELQIPLSQIRCTATRTDKVPNASATAASSGSDLNGMAARDAASTLKQRLTEFAATHYGVDAQAVVFHDSQVQVGAQTLSFAELAHTAWLNRISLSATGFYRTPKIHYDPATMTGRPFYYFAYGAAVSEVIIDTLTGENRVLQVDILHDVGQSLNPALDMGQIEGGFIQGMGWLTTEQLWWDESGRLRTHAPSTYKIPVAGDIPPIFNVRLLENNVNVEQTIYRSKAVGEPPLMLAMSVFFALRDAIASVGDYRHQPPLQAPATPEAILAAVQAVQATESEGA